MPLSTQNLPRRALVPAAILLVTTIAYIAMVRFQFVYDDILLVVFNRYIQSWSHFPQLFTGRGVPLTYPGAPGIFYRPLFLVWFLINHTLFGLNPFWWHLANIGVHVLATWFVFLLARHLTRDSAASAIAALLFGLHPVHIEAVACFSGAEPILAVLFLPAFICYMKFREEGRRGWLWLSLALQAIAVFTKETPLIMPALIVAYEWLGFPSDASGSLPQRLKHAAVNVVPYLLIIAGYMAARISVLAGRGMLGRVLTPLPLKTILLTIPSVLWFYMKMLVYPAGISPFHDSHYVTSPSDPRFIFPLLALLAIAFVLLAAWWHSRSKALAFSVIWMAVTIAPALNFPLFNRGEIAHERYLYEPSVGFCILAGLAFANLPFGRQAPALRWAPALAISALFMVGVITQSTYWANDLVLYHRGTVTAPGNNNAWKNLGYTLMTRDLYTQATSIYFQVMAREPDDAVSAANLGYCLLRLGRLEESENYLARSIALNPSQGDGFFFLAQTELGLDHPQLAERLLQRAIENNPQQPGYHFTLGVAQRRQGKLDQALQSFRAELARSPNPAAQKQIAEIQQMQTAR